MKSSIKDIWRSLYHIVFRGGVFVLKNGEIVISGDAKNIITVENLKEVYGENVCYSSELPYPEISFSKFNLVVKLSRYYKNNVGILYII